MANPADWAKKITAHLEDHPDVNWIPGKVLAEHALGIPEARFDKKSQRLVGEIMKGLGWRRNARRWPTPSDERVMCYIRPGEWAVTQELRDGKLPDDHILKGVSTLVDADGAVKLQWQKTALHQQQIVEKTKQVVATLTEGLRGLAKPVASRRTNFETDILSVYPMGDPHIGMYSWCEETGEDFDCEIAEDLMIGAVQKLVQGAPATENALIINVGDFFHADNLENRTTRSGHVLDVDTRWPRVLRVGVNLMRALIALALRKHKLVQVINAPGNHDDLSAITLNMILQAYYENEPRVVIENNYTNFLKYRFGKTLIGVHHGHDVKLEALPGVMASEWPEDWGETRYRYWITGHVHHSQGKDLHGCHVESFRTLAARDKWAASKGYKSPRDMHRISFHREFGRCGREEVTIEMLQTAETQAAA